jgi:hypothetical protein
VRLNQKLDTALPRPIVVESKSFVFGELCGGSRQYVQRNSVFTRGCSCPPNSCEARWLFNCYGLSEISRLIDIATAPHGDVVRKQL